MYQALYRVWRPQRFEDIAGQEMISQTLKNAIVSRKVSHAYLFTGPRGTGKTSAAKIFAKAINCPNQTDGEPCNQCDICQSITQGALGDIIEIDAASNNGVEEIRDIRDKSRYAPTQVTYKVYIIDEVHMLSTGAFNALLKTLEEPTENVIFILATTEPHKIPATIISRAQRFDFKRITMQHIQNRLAYILEQENITYDTKALPILAKSANGGMRDALSLLDQAISYGQEGVHYEDALQVSGSISQEHMLNYVTNLYQHQTAQALMELQQVLGAGKEASRFVEELLLFARDLLIAQAAPNQTELVDLMVAVPDIDTSFIYTLIDELTKTQQALRLTTQKDIYIETFTVKMAEKQMTVSGAIETPQNEVSIQALKAEVAQLRQQIEQLQKQGVPVATQSQEKGKPSRPKTKPFTPDISKIFSLLARATAKDKAIIQDDWRDIVSCLKNSQQGKLNSATILAASPTGVLLGFEYEVLCQMTSDDHVLRQDLSEHATRILNHSCEIECIPLSQWQHIREQFVQAKKAGTLNQYIGAIDNEKDLSVHQAGAQPIEEIEEQLPHALEDEFLEEQEVPEIIKKAVELFGDIVEVEEN